jgi:hypothetical protein
LRTALDRVQTLEKKGFELFLGDLRQILMTFEKGPAILRSWLGGEALGSFLLQV